MPTRAALVALVALVTAGATTSGHATASAAPRVEVRGIDTVMLLDATQRGQVTVIDESGTRIAFPRLRWSTSDSTIVDVDGTGALHANGPGVATVTVATLGAEVVRRVRVEGVALYVNGERRTYGSDLLPTDRVVISNGRLRLRLGASEEGQKAGTVAELHNGEEWVTGTSVEFGDYTYVASAVTTSPTRVVAVTVNSDVVSVRWVFRDHRFLPAMLRISESYDDQPYPFEKQVWLRSGEFGYYARVRPYEVLPSIVENAEHEIGFGGFWGRGRVGTATQELLVLNVDSAGRRIEPRGHIDAVQFERPDDGVVRVLVPMRPSAFMVPKFSPEKFGSVWIHRLRSESYGAYLYMALSEHALPAREVCAFAFRNPPFMMVAPPSQLELRSCGPVPRR